jgi:hypothetical protein
MGWARVIAIAIFLAAGCTAAPYQRAESTMDVGYFEYEMAPGEWWITYRSRKPTADQVAEDIAHRRAAILCPGGYKEMEPFPYAKEELKYGTVWTCSGPRCEARAQIWVRCDT